MPFVYILLTRTDTLFARALHAAGGGEYTHASLALDRELTRLYSFARRHPRFVLPGGFVREDIHAGVFGRCPAAPSLVLEVPVSASGYAAIRRRLDGMAAAARCWDYDLLGLALAGLGVAHRRPGRFFCSQFVAWTLAKAGAASLPLDPSLTRPADLAALPGARVVYRGPLADAGGRPAARAQAA